jgi:nicotinamidase/pyrazinamidase
MNAYDRETAFLVIDVQNDFADPAGSLSVHGAEQIFPVVNRELERAEARGALIAYTQDWHPETTPHFQKDGGVWPVHCVRGTWGARIHPAVHRVRGATAILKGRHGEDGYSGFSYRDPVTGRVGKTALEDVLRRHGIRRVVVAGLATEYCVKASALDALGLGLDTVVLRDGVRAIDRNPGDGARALEEISRRGAQVVSSEELHAAGTEAAMKGFVDDIEELTGKNDDFRRVLYTGKHLQLVLMCLEPGEEIGEEVHEDRDQFFRIEEGEGEIWIDGERTAIESDDAILVPAGSRHNVVNTGDEPLRFYTLYGPPEHRDGVVHRTKEEALASPEHFDGRTTEPAEAPAHPPAS